MNQLDLFSTTAPAQYDDIPLPSPKADSKPEGEARARVVGTANRAANQRDKILALLREGSVTNFELNTVCLRYSARICELRKAGHDIETVTKIPGKDKNPALVVYRLKEGT